jgi:spermidine synthase
MSEGRLLRLFPRLADHLASGQRGTAVVDRVEVRETLTRLIVNGQLVMSDSDMERRSNREIAWRSHGSVLVAGLGLGYILHSMLLKPTVAQVTVIEKSADVIALVGSSVEHSKLTIVNGDIFDWRPTTGTKFDTIYFDIWPEIAQKNLSDIARLHRAFGRYLVPGGWMSSWCYDELRRRRRWPLMTSKLAAQD